MWEFDLLIFPSFKLGYIFQRSLEFAGKDEDDKDGDNDDDDDDDDNDGDDDDEDSDDVDNDDDEAVAEGMAARQVGGHEWITGHFRLKADHCCCSPTMPNVPLQSFVVIIIIIVNIVVIIITLTTSSLP